LAAAEGLAGFSVDAVAQRAGVSKATIYRRWPSKELMVIDAFHALKAPVTTPDTGSLRGDLDAFFCEVQAGMDDGSAAALLVQVVAALHSNPELEATLRDSLDDRRQPLREILTRAIGRGELPTSTDIDIAMDLLTGPLFFRFLVSGTPVDQHFLHVLRDVVLAGLEKPLRH
jgi:AcrR family transcriptional regulator